MKFLALIDNKKTYILAVIAGLFTVVHFIITSDYSLSSFITLSQDSTIIAMIAALRHAVAKVGNHGNINPQPPNTGVSK
jgi:hypothetical protein